MEKTTRILGWVEFKDPSGRWKSALRIEDLGNEGRPYNLFAFLFGVRNYTGFSPVFGVRGLPNDASPLAREIFERGEGGRFHSPSHVTLGDLKSLKFSGVSGKTDHFPHFYRAEDGTEVSAVVELSEYEERALSEGKELRKGPLILKKERVRRKDILTRGWLAIVGIMEALAISYGGDEGVRAVVWFEDVSPKKEGPEKRAQSHSAYGGR